MKDAAEFAARFFSENNVRRVLIGATDDNLALFRSHLPKAWQSLIVGNFPISMTASHDEVLERAMKAGQEAEHLREKRLVEAVVTGAAKGRGGVVNLDNTLGAIREGRIHTLLISEGFRAPGYRCTGCEYMTAQEMKRCPFCGKEFEKIPDAVELTVRRVLQNGGDVEVLHNNPILKKHGDIGALLRY
jgi:peptide chain release factor subunit 1